MPFDLLPAPLFQNPGFLFLEGDTYVPQQESAAETPFLTMPFSTRLRALCLFLYYSTEPGRSLLPELQFERGRKRRKKKKKRKKIVLDVKSDRKYCPKGFAGMYKGIFDLSQSN